MARWHGRTRWIIPLLWCAALAASLAPPARAQITPGERITLRDTLEKGLKARTDRDRQYLGRVVTLVDQNVIERRLVLTLFDKARAQNSRVPLVPFRFMLAAVTAKKGIEIPY
jgi:hypothetical protein